MAFLSNFMLMFIGFLVVYVIPAPDSSLSNHRLRCTALLTKLGICSLLAGALDGVCVCVRAHMCV